MSSSSVGQSSYPDSAPDENNSDSSLRPGDVGGAAPAGTWTLNLSASGAHASATNLEVMSSFSRIFCSSSFTASPIPERMFHTCKTLSYKDSTSVSVVTSAGLGLVSSGSLNKVTSAEGAGI